MSRNDDRSRTFAELEAENARLRAALSSTDIPLAGSSGPEPPPSRALVTALWESQAALARSEERLGLAFAASGALAWWDWDIPSDRFFASEAFVRMAGADPAKAREGMTLGTFLEGVHPDDRAWVRERIGRGVVEGGDFSEDFRLRAPDGTVRWIHARGRFTLDAGRVPERFLGVSLDITERKAAELRKDGLLALGDALRDTDDINAIARAAAEITARALGAVRAGYGAVDPVRETVLMMDWHVPGANDVSGLHHFRDYGNFIDDLKRGEVVVVADCLSDERVLAAPVTALGIRVLVNVPILVRGRLSALVFVHYDRPRPVSEKEIAFLRAIADRTQAAVARVQAEEERAVLNSELSHRLKNTLTLVQSIASQTLRNAPDLETARDALSLRLIALGKAHDVLLAGERDSADVAELVRGSLDLHADGPDRFRIAGPALRIGPPAALSLVLILHELATNAAKYGALCTEAGRVAVEWTVVGEGDGALLRLAWTETGGPPGAPSARKGFGTRLIERGLAGGEVSTHYRPEGLSCTLTTSLADLGGVV